VWELSLGISLTGKGFKPAPISAGYEREVEYNAVAV
jgi:hypothetical protein